jgi:hypothetical protein
LATRFASSNGTPRAINEWIMIPRMNGRRTSPSSTQSRRSSAAGAAAGGLAGPTRSGSLIELDAISDKTPDLDNSNL